MTQCTEFLGRMQAGDPQARDALFASPYSELHRLAHARLRDGGDRPPLTSSNGVGAQLPDAQETVRAVPEAFEALEALEQPDPRLAHGRAEATLAATFRFAVFVHCTGSTLVARSYRKPRTTASATRVRALGGLVLADQRRICRSRSVIALEIAEFNGVGLAGARQWEKPTPSRHRRAAAIGQVNRNSVTSPDTALAFI